MVKRLLYLNGLAIISTVLHHTAGWGLIAMILWTDRYRPVTVPNFDQVGSVSYYIIRLLGQMIAFAIPAFIFVSGFFIAFATGKSHRTVPWKTVFSRIKFLVIPYLVWCAVAIFGLFLESKTYSLVVYIKLILTGDIKGPYYFVPLLIQLYLIAPFLVPLAKTKWKLLLVIAALLQLATQLFIYSLTLGLRIYSLPEGFFIQNYLFPTRIFWFALGLVVGFHLQPFKLWLTKVKWLMFASTIILLVLAFIEWELIFRANQFFVPMETVVDSLYALSFIFAFLGFEKLTLPLTRQIDALGSNTFGIYLVHVPAQEYSARIIYHVAPQLLGYQFLFLPIIFVAGLFIPLLLMEIVRRSPAKSYYTYIFG